MVIVCRKALAESPCRAAYYPGSEKKAANFRKYHGQAEALGNPHIAENCNEAKVQAMPFQFQAGLSPKQVSLNMAFLPWPPRVLLSALSSSCCQSVMLLTMNNAIISYC